MRSEFRELTRFVIHYEIHKDTATLMALASFCVGIAAWASPLTAWVQ